VWRRGLLSFQKPRSQEKRKRKGDDEEREGEAGCIFVSKKQTSLLWLRSERRPVELVQVVVDIF
jgi:hypothetical protein